ncbi:MAG: sodium:proton antiporter [Saprospiraceae bacterium]|nr:sodium:proton antiporter [Saprospiraceae bacterium]
MTADFGIWSLVPPLVVIVLAILTKRSMEPLVLGCVVGYLMIDYRQFPDNILQSLIKTMQDESLVWVILVCGMYGALIHLMIQSGGALAFGNYMLRYIKTRRNSLLAAWVMGIIIFIDDYLNALVVGATMRKITDHFKVPRELLAYVVNSTSAPVCVLIPLSTWSIYIGKLIEDQKIVEKGQGFYGFVKTIPYNFYAWFAVIGVVLVIYGVIPIMRRMKKAVYRAEETGVLAPQGSEELSQTHEIPADIEKSKPAYFFIPLIVLIAATIALDIDALKGVFVAVLFTIIYYWVIKVLPYNHLFESIFEGFRSMLFALAILIVSYILKNIGDEMGMTQYVIESLQGVVSKAYLPALVFLSLGAIAFATGSSWGIYAIAIPMVVPVAIALDANVWITLGAVISAGTLGAHACFYSDATILTATGTECNNIEHAFTQLPYALMAAGLALVCYLAVGVWGG